MNLITSSGGMFETTQITMVNNTPQLMAGFNFGTQIPIYHTNFNDLRTFNNGLTNVINQSTIGSSSDPQCYKIDYYTPERVRLQYDKVRYYLKSQLGNKYVEFANGSIAFVMEYLDNNNNFTFSAYFFSENFLLFNSGYNPPLKFHYFVTVAQADASSRYYISNSSVSSNITEGVGIFRYVLPEHTLRPTLIDIPLNTSWVSQLNSNIYGGNQIKWTDWHNVCYRYVFDKCFNVYDDPKADITNDDPWGNKPSGTGGGTTGTTKPDKNIPHDPVPIPNLPTISAIDTGFLSVYRPSMAELKQLANYLWSDMFDLDTFKKLFADPMDCILGLQIIPVTPSPIGMLPVKVGNIETSVSLTKTNEQFVEVDCGTLNIKEYFGGYTDYSPYTKISLYLPYIGIQRLSIDDIMNGTITVKYHVDVITGSCVAFVYCVNSNVESVMYTFSGNCATQIPVTSSDHTQIFKSALSTLAIVGGAVTNPSVTALASTVTSVTTAKENVQRTGNLASSCGYLSIQTPYLIMERPNLCVAQNQNKYTGYPSFISSRIGQLKGFTQITDIHLDSVIATDEEMKEITNLLEEGVVL